MGFFCYKDGTALHYTKILGERTKVVWKWIPNLRSREGGLGGFLDPSEYMQACTVLQMRIYFYFMKAQYFAVKRAAVCDPKHQSKSIGYRAR